MKKQRLILIGLALLLSVSISAQSKGEMANNFSVNLISGGSVELEAQEGKVVLIYFFGWNCPSCRGAGGSIQQQLFDAFENDDNFYGISIDTWNGNNSEVQSFINFTGIDTPVGVQGSNAASTLGSTYDRLIVIDASGTIVHKNQSARAGDDINAAKSAIQNALAVTRVNRNELQSVKDVFPNPATDILNVSIEAAQSSTYSIALLSTDGKVVYETIADINSGDETLTLNVNEFDAGYYILNIRSENKFSTNAVIIE
jgi:thiol-disulfide isomerase/thioredoxin